MKKILKRSLLAVGLMITATILTINANAQLNPGGPGYSGSGTLANGSSSSPSVPFDGGMSLILAVSGIGYAANKLRRN